jgi:N-dimethylarginine dimethylaminohydrolase
MDLFFMSPPHPEWSLRGRANFRSKGAAEVDATRAMREWLTLAEGIESLGGTVVVLPPGDAELTGLPYAAEAGHPLPPLTPGGKPRFVLSRMKVAHRQREHELWAPFLERLGFEIIRLEEGIWEGQGDVATFDGATFLFYGGRTDVVGMHAAKQHFGGEVVELVVWEPAFHGNMAILPLQNAAVLVCADVLQEDSLAMLEARVGRDRMHFVSCEEMKLYSTNGLPVGDTVLCPSILPQRVRGMMEKEGMRVAELAMPELCEKAGGASRCLVCRFDDAPSTIQIPDASRLSAWRESIQVR